MRVVSAKQNGWQKVCWELAKAGTAFEIPNVTPKQILFLQELCAGYRYKYKVVGNKLQLTPTNDEIEAELKRLLRQITDSKKHPDNEVMDMCARYVALCLKKENLSEKAIETAQRILDVMEFSVKRSFGMNQ